MPLDEGRGERARRPPLRGDEARRAYRRVGRFIRDAEVSTESKGEGQLGGPRNASLRPHLRQSEREGGSGLNL